MCGLKLLHNTQSVCIGFNTHHFCMYDCIHCYLSNCIRHQE
ncbi:hypothetical protein KUCAC02_024512 [Chaenocephalus aceratus]|uniref:Uncharacterized protein n=1 Tax=Chaenocephalus aceratus TaxID=36190 RepID=A0ACB9WJM9_CHAAC|nr:hypothetical protein KUCAC02_024512 [Chaenocephalus aceratus]